MSGVALAERPAHRVQEGPSEPTRKQVLSDLVQSLLSYQKSERSDRANFAALVLDAQRIFEVDDQEFARRLGVSRPTIGRWVRAETAPHPIGRHGVLLELANWANEKLKFHQNLAKRKEAETAKYQAA
jgi:transcriptional regulator with XRE-family HTH domain